MNTNLDLFLTFLKIGATTFGGGYSMIANIKDIVVDDKHWISDEELLEVTAIAETTPGPIAIDLATYVGWKQSKWKGATLATFGVIIPSLIIIFVISLFFEMFIANKYVAYAFTGIKCGVAFLIIKAAFKLFKNIKQTWWQIVLFILVTIMMVLFDIFNISFSSIYVILIGAVLGLVFNLIFNRPHKEKNEAATESVENTADNSNLETNKDEVSSPESEDK